MKAVLRITALALLVFARDSNAETISRNEVIAIAESYAQYSWVATERNVVHGVDRARVEVHTPNRTSQDSDDRLWNLGTPNTGVPYKWGGFDSLESFAAGIKSGKAAGDLYTPEKRRKGGDAVSPYAVGIDCSGFISRCWRLPKKYSTDSLVSLCRELRSPSELQPGDVMNAQGGHVLLFARWSTDEKSRAIFYEAEPFSKVLAQEHEIASMISSGFRPYRYRDIRD
jgi:hypothetical protein